MRRILSGIRLAMLGRCANVIREATEPVRAGRSSDCKGTGIFKLAMGGGVSLVRSKVVPDIVEGRGRVELNLGSEARGQSSNKTS